MKHISEIIRPPRTTGAATQDNAPSAKTSPRRPKAQLSPQMIEQRLEASREIALKNAQEAGAIGYMARVLVQATLPYREPRGNPSFWERRNGNYSLVIQPGLGRDAKSGNLKRLGYPYGKYPRLVLARLCREAVLNQSPRIILGNSCAEFLRKVGVDANGGRNRYLLQEQIERLFAASISFHYGERGKDFIVDASFDRKIAQERVFFWSLNQPEEDQLFQSYVVLDPTFYSEITEHPVPLDMRALAAFSSCFEIDLYTWLTYRTIRNKGNDFIAFDWLASQLGADYGDSKNFRKAVNRALKRIQTVWSDLRIESTYQGGFILKTTRPHITPSDDRRLILPG